MIMFIQGEKAVFSQLAEQASEKEREELWREAQNFWFLASLKAASAENRDWANCRSEFCRRRAERQGVAIKELNLEAG